MRESVLKEELKKNLDAIIKSVSSTSARYVVIAAVKIIRSFQLFVVVHRVESEDAVKSSEHAKKCVNSSECLDNGHSYCGLSIPFVGS